MENAKHYQGQQHNCKRNKRERFITITNVTQSYYTLMGFEREKGKEKKKALENNFIKCSIKKKMKKKLSEK